MSNLSTFRFACLVLFAFLAFAAGLLLWVSVVLSPENLAASVKHRAQEAERFRIACERIKCREP